MGPNGPAFDRAALVPIKWNCALFTLLRQSPIKPHGLYKSNNEYELKASQISFSIHAIMEAELWISRTKKKLGKQEEYFEKPA